MEEDGEEAKEAMVEEALVETDAVSNQSNLGMNIERIMTQMQVWEHLCFLVL